MSTWGPTISYKKVCTEYLSLGPQDWDYLPGTIDSRMTSEYAAYFTTRRFPRLTCPDDPEPTFDEDDERSRCRALRRLKDGGSGDDGRDGRDGGDGYGYGGDAEDYGGGDRDGGDDDGGDGRAVVVVSTGTLGASSSRPAREIPMDWVTQVVRQRRLGLVDQG